MGKATKPQQPPSPVGGKQGSAPDTNNTMWVAVVLGILTAIFAWLWVGGEKKRPDTPQKQEDDLKKDIFVTEKQQEMCANNGTKPQKEDTERGHETMKPLTVVKPVSVVEQVTKPMTAVEPEPVVEEATMLLTAVEPEPVVEEATMLLTAVEPEPVVEEVTKPVTVVEPEPVVEEVTKPVTVVEPEPVVEVTKPMTVVEPEPVVEVTKPVTVVEPVVEEVTMPLTAVEPEPVVEEASKPVTAVEPEPVVEAASKPVTAVEPEPVVEAASKPVTVVEPEPVVEVTMPLTAVEPEPVVEEVTMPLTAVEPEPVVEEVTMPLTAVEPEPVVEEVTMPLTAVEPEPVVEEVTMPLTAVEPEPVVEEVTMPLTAVEPEPVVEEVTMPLTAVEPEPVVEEATMPLTAVEPEPVVEEATKPVTAVEPEPVVEEATKPVTAVEPEPVVEEATKPVTAVEPEPVVEETTMLLTAVEPEPVVEEATNPLTAVEQEPVVEEATNPLIAVEPEPVVEEVTRSLCGEDRAFEKSLPPLGNGWRQNGEEDFLSKVHEEEEKVAADSPGHEHVARENNQEIVPETAAEVIECVMADQFQNISIGKADSLLENGTPGITEDLDFKEDSPEHSRTETALTNHLQATVHPISDFSSDNLISHKLDDGSLNGQKFEELTKPNDLEEADPCKNSTAIPEPVIHTTLPLSCRLIETQELEATETCQNGTAVEVAKHNTLPLSRSLKIEDKSEFQGPHLNGKTERILPLVSDVKLPEADHAKTKRVAAVQPMPQNVTVGFKVHYITSSDSQQIGIIGDHEKLGGWESYVPLTAEKDGFWSHSLLLPADSSVEWKYVMVENGKIKRWEECGNRSLKTEHEDMETQKWWGFL